MFEISKKQCRSFTRLFIRDKWRSFPVIVLAIVIFLLVGVSENYSQLNADTVAHSLVDNNQSSDSRIEITHSKETKDKFRFEDYKSQRKLNWVLYRLSFKQNAESLINILQKAGAKCEYLSPNSTRCSYAMGEGSSKSQVYVDIVTDGKKYSIYCSMFNIKQDINQNTASSCDSKEEFKFEDYRSEEELTLALHKLSPFGSSSQNMIDAIQKAGAECKYSSPSLVVYIYVEKNDKAIFVQEIHNIIEIFIDNNGKILAYSCRMMILAL